MDRAGALHDAALARSGGGVMPGGRPSSFTQEKADAICAGLADARSLRSICLDDDMPDQVTVFRWLSSFPEFRKQYTHAREAQADAIFDEMLDIADDASNDWMERADEDKRGPGWDLNGEHVQRTRLRLDTRKFMAARLAPKKYGDRVAVEHSVDETTADRLMRARAQVRNGNEA